MISLLNWVDSLPAGLGFLIIYSILGVIFVVAWLIATENHK